MAPENKNLVLEERERKATPQELKILREQLEAKNRKAIDFVKVTPPETPRDFFKSVYGKLGLTEISKNVLDDLVLLFSKKTDRPACDILGYSVDKGMLKITFSYDGIDNEEIQMSLYAAQLSALKDSISATAQTQKVAPIADGARERALYQAYSRMADAGLMPAMAHYESKMYVDTTTKDLLSIYGAQGRDAFIEGMKLMPESDEARQAVEAALEQIAKENPQDAILVLQQVFTDADKENTKIVFRIVNENIDKAETESQKLVWKLQRAQFGLGSGPYSTEVVGEIFDTIKQIDFEELTAEEKNVVELQKKYFENYVRRTAADQLVESQLSILETSLEEKDDLDDFQKISRSQEDIAANLANSGWKEAYKSRTSVDSDEEVFYSSRHVLEMLNVLITYDYPNNPKANPNPISYYLQCIESGKLSDNKNLLISAKNENALQLHDMHGNVFALTNLANKGELPLDQLFNKVFASGKEEVRIYKEYANGDQGVDNHSAFRPGGKSIESYFDALGLSGEVSNFDGQKLDAKAHDFYLKKVEGLVAAKHYDEARELCLSVLEPKIDQTMQEKSNPKYYSERFKNARREFVREGWRDRVYAQAKLSLAQQLGVKESSDIDEQYDISQLEIADEKGAAITTAGEYLNKIAEVQLDKMSRMKVYEDVTEFLIDKDLKPNLDGFENSLYEKFIDLGGLSNMTVRDETEDFVSDIAISIGELIAISIVTGGIGGFVGGAAGMGAETAMVADVAVTGTRTFNLAGRVARLGSRAGRALRGTKNGGWLDRTAGELVRKANTSYTAAEGSGIVARGVGRAKNIGAGTAKVIGESVLFQAQEMALRGDAPESVKDYLYQLGTTMATLGSGKLGHIATGRFLKAPSSATLGGYARSAARGTLDFTGQLVFGMAVASYQNYVANWAGLMSFDQLKASGKIGNDGKIAQGLGYWYNEIGRNNDWKELIHTTAVTLALFRPRSNAAHAPEAPKIDSKTLKEKLEPLDQASQPRADALAQLNKDLKALDPKDKAERKKLEKEIARLTREDKTAKSLAEALRQRIKLAEEHETAQAKAQAEAQAAAEKAEKEAAEKAALDEAEAQKKAAEHAAEVAKLEAAQKQNELDEKAHAKELKELTAKISAELQRREAEKGDGRQVLQAAYARIKEQLLALDPTKEPTSLEMKRVYVRELEELQARAAAIKTKKLERNFNKVFESREDSYINEAKDEAEVELKQELRRPPTHDEILERATNNESVVQRKEKEEKDAEAKAKAETEAGKKEKSDDGEKKKEKKKKKDKGINVTVNVNTPGVSGSASEGTTPPPVEAKAKPTVTSATPPPVAEAPKPAVPVAPSSTSTPKPAAETAPVVPEPVAEAVRSETPIPEAKVNPVPTPTEIEIVKAASAESAKLAEQLADATAGMSPEVANKFENIVLAFNSRNPELQLSDVRNITEPIQKMYQSLVAESEAKLNVVDRKLSRQRAEEFLKDIQNILKHVPFENHVELARYVRDALLTARGTEVTDENILKKENRALAIQAAEFVKGIKTNEMSDTSEPNDSGESGVERISSIISHLKILDTSLRDRYQKKLDAILEKSPRAKALSEINQNKLRQVLHDDVTLADLVAAIKEDPALLIVLSKIYSPDRLNYIINNREHELYVRYGKAADAQKVFDALIHGAPLPEGKVSDLSYRNGESETDFKNEFDSVDARYFNERALRNGDALPNEARPASFEEVGAESAAAKPVRPMPLRAQRYADITDVIPAVTPAPRNKLYDNAKEGVLDMSTPDAVEYFSNTPDAVVSPFVMHDFSATPGDIVPAYTAIIDGGGMARVKSKKILSPEEAQDSDYLQKLQDSLSDLPGSKNHEIIEMREISRTETADKQVEITYTTVLRDPISLPAYERTFNHLLSSGRPKLSAESTETLVRSVSDMYRELVVEAKMSPDSAVAQARAAKFLNDIEDIIHEMNWALETTPTDNHEVIVGKVRAALLRARGVDPEKIVEAEKTDSDLREINLQVTLEAVAFANKIKREASAESAPRAANDAQKLAEAKTWLGVNQNVREVELSDLHMIDLEFAQQLARSPNLESLDLGGLKTMPVEVAAELAKAPQLRHLTLDGLETMSVEVAEALSPKLEYIDLGGLKTMPVEVVAAFVKAPKLNSLWLNGIKTMPVEVAAELAKAPKLLNLGLGGLKTMPVEVAAELAKAPKLQTLWLSALETIDAATARELAKIKTVVSSDAIEILIQQARNAKPEAPAADPVSPILSQRELDELLAEPRREGPTSKKVLPLNQAELDALAAEARVDALLRLVTREGATLSPPPPASPETQAAPKTEKKSPDVKPVAGAPLKSSPEALAAEKLKSSIVGAYSESLKLPEAGVDTPDAYIVSLRKLFADRGLNVRLVPVNAGEYMLIEDLNPTSETQWYVTPFPGSSLSPLPFNYRFRDAAGENEITHTTRYEVVEPARILRKVGFNPQTSEYRFDNLENFERGTVRLRTNFPPPVAPKPVSTADIAPWDKPAPKTEPSAEKKSPDVTPVARESATAAQPSPAELQAAFEARFSEGDRAYLLGKNIKVADVLQYPEKFNCLNIAYFISQGIPAEFVKSRPPTESFIEIKKVVERQKNAELYEKLGLDENGLHDKKFEKGFEPEYKKTLIPTAAKILEEVLTTVKDPRDCSAEFMRKVRSTFAEQGLTVVEVRGLIKIFDPNLYNEGFRTAYIMFNPFRMPDAATLIDFKKGSGGYGLAGELGEQSNTSISRGAYKTADEFAGLLANSNPFVSRTNKEPAYQFFSTPDELLAAAREQLLEIPARVEGAVRSPVAPKPEPTAEKRPKEEPVAAAPRPAEKLETLENLDLNAQLVGLANSATRRAFEISVDAPERAGTFERTFIPEVEKTGMRVLTDVAGYYYIYNPATPEVGYVVINPFMRGVVSKYMDASAWMYPEIVKAGFISKGGYTHFAKETFDYNPFVYEGARAPELKPHVNLDSFRKSFSDAATESAPAVAPQPVGTANRAPSDKPAPKSTSEKLHEGSSDTLLPQLQRVKAEVLQNFAQRWNIEMVSPESYTREKLESMAPEGYELLDIQIEPTVNLFAYAPKGVTSDMNQSRACDVIVMPRLRVADITSSFRFGGKFAQQIDSVLIPTVVKAPVWAILRVKNANHSAPAEINDFLSIVKGKSLSVSSPIFKGEIATREYKDPFDISKGFELIYPSEKNETFSPDISTREFPSHYNFYKNTDALSPMVVDTPASIDFWVNKGFEKGNKSIDDSIPLSSAEKAHTLYHLAINGKKIKIAPEEQSLAQRVVDIANNEMDLATSGQFDFGVLGKTSFVLENGILYVKRVSGKEAPQVLAGAEPVQAPAPEAPSPNTRAPWVAEDLALFAEKNISIDDANAYPHEFGAEQICAFLKYKVSPQTVAEYVEGLKEYGVASRDIFALTGAIWGNDRIPLDSAKEYYTELSGLRNSGTIINGTDITALNAHNVNPHTAKMYYESLREHALDFGRNYHGYEIAKFAKKGISVEKIIAYDKMVKSSGLNKNKRWIAPTDVADLITGGVTPETARIYYEHIAGVDIRVSGETVAEIVKINASPETFKAYVELAASLGRSAEGGNKMDSHSIPDLIIANISPEIVRKYIDRFTPREMCQLSVDGASIQEVLAAAKEYSRAFTPQQIRTFFVMGFNAQVANKYEKYANRYHAEDIAIIEKEGLNVEVASQFNEHFYVPEVAVLMKKNVDPIAANMAADRLGSYNRVVEFAEAGMSVNVVKDYDSRFTSQDIDDLLANKLYPNSANNYAARFSGRDIVTLRSSEKGRIVVHEIANEYDTRFSANDILNLYENGIDYRIANAFNDAFSAHDIFRLVSMEVSKDKANDDAALGVDGIIKKHGSKTKRFKNWFAGRES